MCIRDRGYTVQTIQGMRVAVGDKDRPARFTTSLCSAGDALEPRKSHTPRVGHTTLATVLYSVGYLRVKASLCYKLRPSSKPGQNRRKPLSMPYHCHPTKQWWGFSLSRPIILSPRHTCESGGRAFHISCGPGPRLTTGAAWALFCFLILCVWVFCLHAYLCTKSMEARRTWVP